MVNILLVIVVLSLTWVAFQSKKRVYQKIIQGKDLFLATIVEKILTALILFVSGLIILQILGINVGPLITFGGIGAAAVGFACKDVIANFFGGFMIYATRPFAIGDIIEMPKEKILGHVESIGWYFTCIRDLRKQCLYIPNSRFANEVLLNQSRMTHRRIDEKIRIRGTDSDKGIVYIEQIRQLFKQNKYIDQEKPLEIFLLSIGPWGLEVEIKAYTQITNSEKFLQLRQELLWEVYNTIYQK